MKNIWVKPFAVFVGVAEGKIIGCYYMQNYYKEPRLYSTDGKQYKPVTDDEYVKFVKDYNDKWVE